MWVIIQNGEQEGPFETEQEAYSYIVAYWPEWRIKESFEVKECEAWKFMRKSQSL